MTAQPLFSEFKLKSLPGSAELVPDAVYWIKPNGSEVATAYITDSNGAPFPLSINPGGVSTVDVTASATALVVTLHDAFGLTPLVSPTPTGVSVSL